MGPGSHTQWSTFRGSNEEYSSRQSYMGGLQERAAQMINRRFVPALKAAGAKHEVGDNEWTHMKRVPRPVAALF